MGGKYDTWKSSERRPGVEGREREAEERKRAVAKGGGVWPLGRSGEEGGEAVGNWGVALHRKQPGLDRQQPDQGITKGEDRNRKAEHRETHHETIDPRARFPRRDGPQRHRDGDREDQGQ